MYIYLHFYIIPTLFAYFLARHSYIVLHFQRVFFSLNLDHTIYETDAEFVLDRDKHLEGIYVPLRLCSLVILFNGCLLWLVDPQESTNQLPIGQRPRDLRQVCVADLLIQHTLALRRNGGQHLFEGDFWHGIHCDYLQLNTVLVEPGIIYYVYVDWKRLRILLKLCPVLQADLGNQTVLSLFAMCRLNYNHFQTGRTTTER